jgi:hypothetical protein
MIVVVVCPREGAILAAIVNVQEARPVPAEKFCLPRRLP